MYSLLWLTFLTQIAFAQRISTSARCGPSFGLTCQGSKFGNCCSQYSWCGSTNDYCGQGCLPGYGECKGITVPLSGTSRRISSSIKTVSHSTPAASSLASPTLPLSQNARCGFLYGASPGGMTCSGSRYGNCCSQWSYCGDTDAYCGVGCQKGFSKGGSCKNAPSLSVTTSRPSSATTRALASTALPLSRSTTLGTLKSSSTVSSSANTRQSSTSQLRSETFSIRTSMQSSFSQSSITTHPIILSSSVQSSSSATASASTLSPELQSSQSYANSIVSSSSFESMVSISQSNPLSPSTTQSLISFQEPVFSTPATVFTPFTQSQVSGLSLSSSMDPISSFTVSVSSSAELHPTTSSSTSSIYLGSVSVAEASLSSLSTSTISIISTEVSMSFSAVETQSPSLSSSVGVISSSSDGISLFYSSTESQSTPQISSSSTNTIIPTSFSVLSSILEAQTPTSSSSLSIESVSSSGASSWNSSPELHTTASDSSSSMDASSLLIISSWTTTFKSSTTPESSSTPDYHPATTAGSSLLSTEVVISSSIESSTLISDSSASASSSSIEPDCKAVPSPTCNRAQDCPDYSNYLVASPTYNVPVYTRAVTPTVNVSVPVQDLTVGTEYVLTFYSYGATLGSGSNSCCNITAFIDDVPISQYCSGFYYSSSLSRNGPFQGIYNAPRSPAVVYRATVRNPRLEFAVMCPTNEIGILVHGIQLISPALVPRCTCQELNMISSIKSQPLNRALNGNFADFDERQESPILGWQSEENWYNTVNPVRYDGYNGVGLSDDMTNNGNVVLVGPKAAIHRTISGLDPSAMYNVSFLWQNSYAYDCNLVLKFNNEIIINLPRSTNANGRFPMLRNWITFFPQASSGILWIGSVCLSDFDGQAKRPYFPSVRIDDVAFTGVELKNDAYCGSSEASTSRISSSPTPIL